MLQSSVCFAMHQRGVLTMIIVLLGVLCISTMFTGCAQVSGAARHGWEGDEYENTYLSTASPLGAKALNNWRDYDIDVSQFLDKYREPDVIYSKFMEVTFFYLNENVQVKFDRPAVGFKTDIESTKIPEDLYQQLLRRFD